MFNGTAPFNIGRLGGTATTYHDGSTDEVVLYKRILTAAERTWLYNGGSGRTYTDLTATSMGWYDNDYKYTGSQPHAVTEVDRGDFSDTFTYDQNGNMACRTESNITYLQTYNAENRIASIAKLASGDCSTPGNYAAKWDFGYDGDGVRTSQLYTPYNASGEPQGATVTSYFFGGALESSGAAGSSSRTVKKYYSFAGQSIAMKDADFAVNGFKYFLSDHLGSVSLVLYKDQNNIEHSEQQRYLPFGQPRAMSPAITSTDLTYTGQRALPDTGLMDYRARFYSPSLGRFLQPDSIIPGAANPQSWNRYSYTVNNPVRFNDPTGHEICDADGYCGGQSMDPATYLKKSILHQYGITMSEEDDANNSDAKAWDLQNLRNIYSALGKINGALNGKLKSLVGGATFKWGEHDPNGGTSTYHGLTYSTTISFYTIGNAAIRQQNIFHEFGHLIDNSPGMVDVFSQDPGINNSDFLDDNGYLDSHALIDPNHDMIQHPMSINGADPISAQQEHWADIFANYVAGNINSTSLSGAAMNTFITGALAPYIGTP